MSSVSASSGCPIPTVIRSIMSRLSGAGLCRRDSTALSILCLTTALRSVLCGSKSTHIANTLHVLEYPFHPGSPLWSSRTFAVYASPLRRYLSP